MNNIINSNIKVSKMFLNKIKNQTIGYKKTSNIKYGTLFCDMNKVVGVEFSDDGSVICRSSLLLDEEEDILDEVSLFEDYDFSYKVLDNVDKNIFLTRKEVFKRRYLLKEIFGKDNKKIENKYKRIIEDIKNNYNYKYNNLYNIVRLSYQKK